MQLDLISFDEANEGIQAAARRATEVDPALIPRLIAQAGRFFDGSQRPATIEQARSACDTLPSGVDGRVWGHVTRRLIADKRIEATGQFAPARSSHGSPKPLYRAMPR